VRIELVSADAVPLERLRSFLCEAWHADAVVAHGERIVPAELPGIAAMDGDRIVGHVSYRWAEGVCELTSIVADPRGQGIGTRLLEAAVAAAREAGCHRLWLTTTNDNLDALAFYQRRGFHLARLRPGAVDRVRAEMKPELPMIGTYGIPMRDELDLERDLASA
jgi:GNAT superfamily N-acetyltransferase